MNRGLGYLPANERWRIIFIVLSSAWFIGAVAWACINAARPLEDPGHRALAHRIPRTAGRARYAHSRRQNRPSGHPKSTFTIHKHRYWVPCPRLCVGMLHIQGRHAHAKPWAWHPKSRQPWRELLDAR